MKEKKTKENEDTPTKVIVVEDDDLGRHQPDFQTFQEQRDWDGWEPNSWGY